jgi:hypothetical protein
VAESHHTKQTNDMLLKTEESNASLGDHSITGSSLDKRSICKRLRCNNNIDKIIQYFVPLSQSSPFRWTSQYRLSTRATCFAPQSATHNYT